MSRVFLWNLGEMVCRQRVITGIIRNLRVALHLQFENVPSWRVLVWSTCLKHLFAIDSSSSSHHFSFDRCRSLLNVCMCKDHLVSSLQACFRSNVS